MRFTSNSISRSRTGLSKWHPRRPLVIERALRYSTLSRNRSTVHSVKNPGLRSEEEEDKNACFSHSVHNVLLITQIQSLTKTTCYEPDPLCNKTEWWTKKAHIGGVLGKEMEVRVALPIMYVLIKCVGLVQGMRGETRL